jgi:hypothetical protein
MIDELGIETELPVTAIYEVLAAHYECDAEDIREKLKEVDSKYVANNNVLGFINGKPYKRTAVATASSHIMVKVRERLIAAGGLVMGNETAEVIHGAIKDHIDVMTFGRELNC